MQSLWLYGHNFWLKAAWTCSHMCERNIDISINKFRGTSEFLFLFKIASVCQLLMLYILYFNSISYFIFLYSNAFSYFIFQNFTLVGLFGLFLSQISKWFFFQFSLWKLWFIIFEKGSSWYLHELPIHCLFLLQTNFHLFKNLMAPLHFHCYRSWRLFADLWTFALGNLRVFSRSWRMKLPLCKPE